MDVKLILPDRKYLDSYIEACDEISKYSPNEERIYSYSEDMFEKFELRRQGIGLKPGYVADTHLWLVEGDEFIGAVGIRHQLNKKLLGYGGTIGYGVRYFKRNKGYCTKMLSLTLKYCNEVLGMTKVMITCNVDNYASEKVMLNNGAVFAGIIDAADDDGNPVKIKKYWINIKPYIIDSDRFYLREYKESDFDDLCEIYTDPENMKDFGEVYTKEKVRHLMEWTFKNYATYGFGFWAIIDKNSGDFIGDCGLSMQKIDGEWLPEIGYHIKKKYHNQHYASDAAKLVKEYGFKRYTFDKLYSYTNKGNNASVGVMKNNGMSFVKEYEDNGEQLVVYAVEREKA